LASHPGLAIVQTMVTQTGPGTAAEAASWAAAYGLTNVHVWADTTNYMYWNFTSQPAIGGYYPSTMIIDVDTMTMTAFQQTGVETLTAAIDAILNADHPCAE
jgi:hypothetical protein